MNPLQLFNFLSKAQNPMGLLQQMSTNNPKLKRAIEITHGKTPEEVEKYVRNAFKTQGKDINEFAQKLGLQLPQ